jgi:hypothetical protein
MGSISVSGSIGSIVSIGSAPWCIVQRGFRVCCERRWVLCAQMMMVGQSW